MAYIGAEPAPGQNREVDDISSSFNGSTTAFTLQVSGVNVSPESANNILVNLGGVLQNPGTDYTIAASTLTFTTAPASGLSFFALVLGAGINTATVADDTIGASKLINTAVTAGSYTTADITVDAQGRITAAASGTISGAEIADQAVTNAKVNNSAAIAGSKISPDFGSQNIVTTGSISGAAGTLTGDLTIPDTIVHTGDTNTKIRFPAADTVSIETGGSERFRVNDTGVGIGTNAPAQKLHVDGASNDPFLLLQRSGAGDSAVDLGGVQMKNSTNVLADMRARSVDINDGVLKFSTMGAGTLSERMIIDNSGNVLIGTDSANKRLTIVDRTDAIAMIIGENNNATTEAGLRIQARNTANSSGFNLDISVDADAPAATFDFGGSEAMAISNSQKVGIGTTAPSGTLTIKSGTAALAVDDEAQLTIQTSSTGSGANIGGGIMFLNHDGSGGAFGGSIQCLKTNSNNSDQSNYLRFSSRLNNQSVKEGMRLTEHQRLRVNCDDMTTDPSSSNKGVMIGSTSSGTIFSNGAATGFSNNLIFLNGNGVVGTVTTNGSNTAYNTSSDYRLKENATAISDGITRLKTLKPYRFNFKADANTTVDGFFAHEVTAVPEAITGTKDETQDILYTEEDTIPSGKEVGDVKETIPVYQGIDQSKLVPLLTAALQEAITKIETLETKVAALEAA